MKINVRDMLKILEGMDPDKPVRFHLLTGQGEEKKEFEIVMIFNDIKDSDVTFYLD